MYTSGTECVLLVTGQNNHKSFDHRIPRTRMVKADIKPGQIPTDSLFKNGD